MDDIALIVLPKKLSEMEETAETVKMTPLNLCGKAFDEVQAKQPSNLVLVSLGMGRNSVIHNHGCYPKTLQQIKVEEHEQGLLSCQFDIEKEIGTKISKENEIRGLVTTTSGDSGGPLLWFDKRRNKALCLYGVTANSKTRINTKSRINFYMGESFFCRVSFYAASWEPLKSLVETQVVGNVDSTEK